MARTNYDLYIDILRGGSLRSTEEKPMQHARVTILYDNGKTHTEKGLVKTNALTVQPSSEGKGYKFLSFTRKKPTEVHEGVFQQGAFDVDMCSIAALQITKPNGEIVLRKFKSCAKVQVLLTKQ